MLSDLCFRDKYGFIDTLVSTCRNGWFFNGGRVDPYKEICESFYKYWSINFTIHIFKKLILKLSLVFKKNFEVILFTLSYSSSVDVSPN